jgi:hypothetical protein
VRIATSSCGSASGLVHASTYLGPSFDTLPTVSSRFQIAVERWAAQQLDKPTLAEALRRLVEDGLASD